MSVIQTHALAPVASRGLLFVLLAVASSGCPALLSDPYRIEVDGASTDDAGEPTSGESGGGGDGAGGSCGPGQLSCAGGCVPNDAHNCGKCGHDCTSLPNVTGPVTCNQGVCVFQPTSCAPGYAHCSGAADQGCETNVTAPTHCGLCGNVCPASAPLCAGGGTAYACSATCPANSTLCSGSCVDTQTSAANCGACGRACDTRTGTPSCPAGACAYVCKKGRSDCNAATAPDLDGCECATTGCCGTGCQNVHSNGAGQSFGDCAALGTYDATQATEACAAFTGSATACTQGMICCGFRCPFSMPYEMSVCGSASGVCRCWEYAGANVGRLRPARC